MSVANAPEQPATPHESLLARHPLIFYFFITFAFSWLLFLPILLTYYGVLNLSLRFNCAGGKGCGRLSVGA